MQRTLKMTAAMLLALGTLNIASVAMARDHGTRDHKPETHGTHDGQAKLGTKSGPFVLSAQDSLDAKDHEDHAGGSASGDSEGASESDHSSGSESEADGGASGSDSSN